MAGHSLAFLTSHSDKEGVGRPPTARREGGIWLCPDGRASGPLLFAKLEEPYKKNISE